MKQYRIIGLKPITPPQIEIVERFKHVTFPIVVREFAHTNIDGGPFRFFIPITTAFVVHYAQWFDFEELDSSEYHPLKMHSDNFYYPEPYPR